MNTELPMPEKTADKLRLIKEEILQIIANPEYKKFLAELRILKNFLAGKTSIQNAHEALKKLTQSTSS